MTLYEKRPDPRRQEGSAGKSINLALSNRGLRALGLVGLEQAARDMAIPMRGRMMHDGTGELTFQPYGTKSHHVLNSISRGGLNRLLLDAAEQTPGVNIVFNAKLLSVDLDAGTAQVDLESREQSIEAGRMIGADGAFSNLRAAMSRESGFNFSQDYLDYAYKELLMPADDAGGFAMEKHALHIWPRRTYMLIGLPNADETYTMTLFWPIRGKSGFEDFEAPGEVTRFFQKAFPDAVPLIPDLEEQFQENPQGSLVTIRCFPYRYKDRALLIGDAAHAVVPFYGQGMNAAFEDCTVLDQCIEKHAPDWDRVFESYQRERKLNMDALADLALNNFVEMRDHVGTSSFLARKRWERFLARALPGIYRPLYSMVTFSDTPYAEAVSRAERQDRLIAQIIGFVLLISLVMWLAAC